MKSRIISFLKSLGVLAAGMFLTLAFISSLASEEIILAEGDGYQNYGFKMENLRYLTLVEYGGQEVAVYDQRGPEAVAGARKTFAVREDIGLTMSNGENGAVKITINFNLPGMIWKKIRRLVA